MRLWLAALLLAAALIVWRGRSPGSRLRSWRTRASEPAGRASRSALPALVAGAVVGGGAVAVGVPPVAAGAVGVALAVADRARRSRRSSDQQAQRAVAVVEITFALAGELRAGRTPAEALAAIAATAGPLAEPISAAHLAAIGGGSAADVLCHAATVPGAERLRSVASAWRVAETSGGRVAAVLDRLGEAMDADLRLRQELDAALSGPRATMLLLAVLPAFGLLLGQAMGANPLRLLIHRPIGWGLLAVAGALDCVGVWLLRRIIASASGC